MYPETPSPGEQESFKYKYLNRVLMRAKVADALTQGQTPSTNASGVNEDELTKSDDEISASDETLRAFYRDYLDRGFMYLTMDPNFAINPAFASALAKADNYDQVLRPQLIRTNPSDNIVATNDSNKALNHPISNNRDLRLYERVISDYTLLQALQNLDALQKNTNPTKINIFRGHEREVFELLKTTDLNSIAALARGSVLNYLPQGETLPEVTPSYDITSMQRSFDNFMAAFRKSLSSPENYLELNHKLESNQGLVEDPEDFYRALAYIPELCSSLQRG